MRPARVAFVLLGLSACAESPVVATIDAAVADVAAADQPISLDAARDAAQDLGAADAPPEDRAAPIDIALDAPPPDLPSLDALDVATSDTPADASAPLDVTAPIDAPDVAPDVAADLAPDLAPDVAPDVPADVPRDVVVDAAPVCTGSAADCDGIQGNGCEVDLRSNRDHCGACGVRCCGPCIDGACWADGIGLTVCARGPDGCHNYPRNLLTDPEACGRCDNACAQGEVCQAGVCTPPSSCLGIFMAGRSVGDGVYTITLLGARVQVRCLMSADGGGWTQVMNYPAGTAPSAVPAWNSGNAVGNAFGDANGAWRLSDAQINALRTTAYRARGTAARCIGGPCTLNHTLYWRGDCAFSSSASSAACATAFFDAALTMPTGNTTPCGWHVGLTDTRCGAQGGIITNHTTNGIIVCTGDPRSFEHSCSARGSEDPGLAVWVR